MKGAIAEAVIAAEAVKAGVGVLRPVVEGLRYDLVFDVGGHLLRVQCKSGRVHNRVVVVGTRTCRHTPNGYVRSSYSAAEIDAIAVYCAQAQLLLPPADRRGRRAPDGPSATVARSKRTARRGTLCGAVRVPWGYSSVGRALDWQSRGRGFESP